jgi:molecular chaperone GrpE
MADKPEKDGWQPEGDDKAQAAAAGQSGAANGAKTGAGQQDMSGDVAKLRSQLAESQENELRTQAELENFRKRARRELDDERRYANVPLLRDLLPVVDNMERAISAAQKTPEASILLEGVRMVAQSLHGVLARHHCKRIEALGKPFDPAVHEAIAQQPSADHPPNTVLLVAHEGYMVHDRVVRPAQVIVSTAPA